jgi:hypothetical protein
MEVDVDAVARPHEVPEQPPVVIDAAGRFSSNPRSSSASYLRIEERALESGGIE